MKKLPLYLLIDGSSSMSGHRMEGINNGLQYMLSVCTRDPFLLDMLHISIMTFDLCPDVVVPLTKLEETVIPAITSSSARSVDLDLAFDAVFAKIQQELLCASQHQKGDFSGCLIVIYASNIGARQKKYTARAHVDALGFAKVIGCEVGSMANTEYFSEIFDHVFALKGESSDEFVSLFSYIVEVLAMFMNDHMDAPLLTNQSKRSLLTERV